MLIKKFIIIINGKSFYDQPTYSDIKRHNEMRKLMIKQGENYTTGCLLDYNYIKNHYKLEAAVFSRQEEFKSNLRNRIS